MSATKPIVERIEFQGLANSSDQSQTPTGFAYAMSNANVDNKVLQGGARYGDVTRRPAFSVNDKGYGLHYCEFRGIKEWLAVVQPNGAGAASLYSINPDTRVWTAISTGVPAPTNLDASDWYFVQYEDKVYAGNAVSGMFVRVIGGGTTANDAWQPFGPEFQTGADASLSTLRPAYVPQVIATSTVSTVTIKKSSASKDQVSANVRNTQGDIELVNRWVCPDDAESFVQLIITFSSAIDLSHVDFIGFSLIRPGEEGAVIPHGYNGSNYWTFKLSENAAGTLNQAFFDGMTTVADPQNNIQSAGQRKQDLTATINLQAIPAASRDAVRRIGIGFWIDYDQNQDFLCYLRNLTYGGALMWDKTGDAPIIDYAFTYFDPVGTTRESPATKRSLSAGTLNGYPMMPGLMKGGAWVQIDPTPDPALAALGYTQIKLYRRETSNSSGAGITAPPSGGGVGGSGGSGGGSGTTTTDHWRLLATLNNVGTPSWVDTVRESLLNLLPENPNLQFGDIPVTLNPTAMGFWNQHLLLGLDRKAFFSWGGLPRKFLPPPEDVINPPDESDLIQGRTLYMSANRADEVIAFVSQDPLYLCGKNLIYAMVGDSAELATPPRRLPGNRGCVGTRAAIAHRGAALIASYDAIWSYSVSRAFTGSYDSTYGEDESTSNVRGTWRRFIGATTGSRIVMASHDNEVWAFNGTNGRFIHLTKNGFWEEGTWPAVRAAIGVPFYGLNALLEDGSFIRVGYDATGAAYTTDGGTAVDWSYELGTYFGIRRRLVGITVEATGEPTFEITPLDGAQARPTETIMRTGDKAQPLPINVPPGFAYRIVMRGRVGRDTIKSLIFRYEPFESEGN